MNSSKFHEFSIIVILFSLFLTPTIYVPGIIGVRLEEIYLLLFTVIVTFARKESCWTFQIPLRVVLLFVFLPLMAISTLMGALLALPATFADSSKIMWLIKAILIYLVFYNFIHSDVQGRAARVDFVLHWFVKFATISTFICFQQYFNLFNLNSIYIPLIAPTQYITLTSDHATPRVVGMLGNPNLQGFVISLAIVALIYLILNKKAKLLNLNLVLLLTALFMTLSRSALLALVVGSVYLFIMFRKPVARYFLVKAGVGVLLIVIVYNIYSLLIESEILYNAILFRYELLQNPNEDISFAARYDGWRINWDYFKASPVFGVGLLPRAVDIFYSADNEWLHFLRSFGIVGIVWLGFFLLFPILFKKNLSLDAKNQTHFISAVLLHSFTFMIPAAVITSPITFSFLLIFLSISDRTMLIIKHRIV